MVNAPEMKEIIPTSTTPLDAATTNTACVKNRHPEELPGAVNHSHDSEGAQNFQMRFKTAGMI